MERTKDIFIKMREDEYNQIPSDIKERFFNSKNVTKEVNDFDLNMKDDLYAKLYKQRKKISKDLEEREYQLREQRRKENALQQSESNRPT